MTFRAFHILNICALVAAFAVERHVAGPTVLLVCLAQAVFVGALLLLTLRSAR